MEVEGEQNVRRSARVLRREINRVANDSETDYASAFSGIVTISRQLNLLLRIITEAARMDSTSDFTMLHIALDQMEASQDTFLVTYPAMLGVPTCSEMFTAVRIRLQQCRDILAVAQTMPPSALSAAQCAALPAYVPEADAVCSVCCDGGDEPWLKLPCGHAFHRSCVTDWLTNHKRTCPLCRAPVS